MTIPFCQSIYLTCTRSDDGRPCPSVVRASDQRAVVAIFESISSRTRIRYDSAVWQCTGVSNRRQCIGEVRQSWTRAFNTWLQSVNQSARIFNVGSNQLIIACSHRRQDSFVLSRPSFDESRPKFCLVRLGGVNKPLVYLNKNRWE